MGSIEIKLLLAEEIQLPLTEMEPAIKQAVSLYNRKKICNLLHTINPEVCKANTSSFKWSVLQMVTFLPFVIVPSKIKETGLSVTTGYSTRMSV